MLTGRRITLAVTGGIAAYKACEMVRALIRAGADVRVAMTENATRFVGEVTFAALSGHPVSVREFTPGATDPMPHINLTRESDLLIVMPATANILAKAANGIADDLVSALILARRTPVVFVPAMNRYMWENPATQRNVAQLKADGAHFIGPQAGFQACGDNGTGRMMEPAAVLDRLPALFTEQRLAGRRVVITAGPTFEAIDKVRGLTNRSSGRQGFALARAARDAGAEVVLVAGPVALTTPEGVTRIDVVSAREMHDAVHAALDAAPADLFIGVAAVCDWRVNEAQDGKIKKTGNGTPQWTLTENPDILASVARRADAPVTVGFAAECDNVIDYARAKCAKKGCAFVAANRADDALNSPDNCVWLVDAAGADKIGPADKYTIACRIIDRAAKALIH